MRTSAKKNTVTNHTKLRCRDKCSRK